MIAPFLLIGLTLQAQALPIKRVERKFYAMGTDFEVTVHARSRAHALTLGQAMVRTVANYENQISTWNPNSELSQVNRQLTQESTPAPIPLSRSLRDSLEQALTCANLTDGAFDPTLGRLIEVWHLRTQRLAPNASALKIAQDKTGFHKVSISGSELRASSQIMFEEGAFAKGRALDLALDQTAVDLGTRKIKSVTLNFGGQISQRGNPPLLVQLSDPVDRQKAVLHLEIHNESLSTSGNSARGPHILDPRAGGIIDRTESVSVLAPTGFWADCLSTAFFVMGQEKAFAWVRANPNVKASVIYLRKDGDGKVSITVTPDLRDRIHPVSSAMRVAGLGLDQPQRTK